MNHIEELICKALQEADNKVLRAQAEQQIYQVASQNYTEFFLTLAKIISDRYKPVFSRQSSATVFKLLISFKVTSFLHRISKASFSGIKSL